MLGCALNKLTVLQMFVSTEIENPDPRVTRLIEDIVRNQVIEMVCLTALNMCFSRMRADHSVASALAAAYVQIPRS